MSTNGNRWKPRKSEKWICPSGQEVWLRAPGPEFTLRLGKTPNTLSSLPARKEGQSDEDYKREIAERMSDEDLVNTARELLVAMVESPRLTLNPDYEKGEIGPDDTDMDFWPIFNYGTAKYFNREGKVKVAEGEVEVTDLETFRHDSGVSGHSADGVLLPVTEPESTTEDQRLVPSAGA